MKSLLKFVLLFFAFVICFILPAVFIPLEVIMETQSRYNAPLLFLLLLVDFLILIYLITHLTLTRVKLFLTILLVFWGLQTFMTQIETWYFIEAMPTISIMELRNLFLRPLITSVIFIPLAILVLGKWKKDTSHSTSNLQANLKWHYFLGLSVAYVFIYFLFGYAVAWQFEEVRLFYSGSAVDVGFIEQLKQTFQTKPFILPFQLVRGLLWIIMGLPMLMYFKGNRKEIIITCCIIYSLLPSLLLIVDNPFMPPAVRLAHLLEVASSNGLFGFLIGYTFARKSFSSN